MQPDWFIFENSRDKDIIDLNYYSTIYLDSNSIRIKCIGRAESEAIMIYRSENSRTSDYQRLIKHLQANKIQEI